MADKTFEIKEKTGTIFGRRTRRRFQTGAREYSFEISFNETWEGRRMLDMDREMEDVWQELFRHLRAVGTHEDDLVRIHIGHSVLTHGDITVSLRRFRDLNTRDIWTTIENILQSYQTLTFDSSLKIICGVIFLPRGGTGTKMICREEGILSKKSIIRINNNDNMCMARALIVCEGYSLYKKDEISAYEYEKIRKDKCKLQTIKALDLHEKAGIETDEMCSIVCLPVFEAVLDCEVVVFSANANNKIIYPTELKNDGRPVYFLYHVEDHFHGINSAKGFLGIQYFCKHCLRGYQNSHKHKCAATCFLCKTLNCIDDDTEHTCDTCHFTFHSQACFDRHRYTTKGKTMCERRRKCPGCYMILNGEEDIEKHICGMYDCPTCYEKVPIGQHKCFMRATKKEKPVDKLIFFDFECMIIDGRHIPNYVVAERVCRSCEKGEESCDKCGPPVVFMGEDTLDLFGRWLFDRKNKNATVMAHNMKGYDGHFLVQYMAKNGIHFDPIFQGSKILTIRVHSGLGITLLDSLNFLPMPLRKLPKAFGFEEAKGDFPIFFNLPENQTYVGEYPAPEYYGVDTKSTEERESFLAWLESKKGHTFNFRDEMHKYCVTDVSILRKACLKFRSLMLDITGVDPFNYITIASVCMGVYKSCFYKEQWRTPDTVVAYTKKNGSFWKKGEELDEDHHDLGVKFFSGQLAVMDHSPKDVFSAKSIHWLRSREEKDGSIRHALSPDGEYQVGPYKVDGYRDGVCYEFNGCVFHGCPKCYTQRSVRLPLTGETADVLYHRTLKKKEYLKSQGYKVVSIWEHEYNAKPPPLTGDTIFERLDPRDSFFGGRTNATRLHYQAKEGEKIRYVDFTSLYPSVNKQCAYPLGHPEIIVNNFKPLTEYFGIAKIEILPPPGLYHPVLPVRAPDGKLHFPLCAKCSQEENQEECQCSDEDRRLTGTWCIPEINKAVEKGYKVLRVIEVYHWKKFAQYDPVKKKGGLFTEYVNTFLKLKQEASGWPEWCTTPEDKDQYIQDYARHEGVNLDPNNIEKNPGMRSLAKLMLNSFWGKFAQRPNMMRTSMITDLNEFYTTLLDQSLVVKDFHILNEQLIQLDYEVADQFHGPEQITNIYIATFTTCWARLRLYDVLDKVQRRCIYYDTDSVFYIDDGSVKVELGDYLGQLTNELRPGRHIVEFVSGGPKNYGYREDDGEETVKVRGFRLNYTNSRIITFDAIKEMLVDRGQSLHVTDPKHIQRDRKTYAVSSVELTKKYSIVYTKRRILSDLDTVPYGY